MSKASYKVETTSQIWSGNSKDSVREKKEVAALKKVERAVQENRANKCAPLLPSHLFNCTTLPYDPFLTRSFSCTGGKLMKNISSRCRRMRDRRDPRGELGSLNLPSQWMSRSLSLTRSAKTANY